MYSGVLSAVTGIWVVRKRLLLGWRGGEMEVDNEFEYFDVENAEVVKDKILGLRDWVAAGITGVGFIFAVIGGYGEGFTD